MMILGNRDSTIEFENYFRENARKSIEVYFEVVFWKLYSQMKFSPNQKTRASTKKIMEYIISVIQKKGVHQKKLYDAIDYFVALPNLQNLRSFRILLGLKKALAIPLTFPAFLDPEHYPMVDRNVAQWVNVNLNEHNRNRQAKLTQFCSLYEKKTLTDDDFRSYLNWVYWCREIAQVLTEKTRMCWRARDVEMAIFTAQRQNLKLPIL
jgi:hypothetical protein